MELLEHQPFLSLKSACQLFAGALQNINVRQSRGRFSKQALSIHSCLEALCSRLV